ncbi:hypothetical protein LCGC14_2597410, partial [marine sediment metagenome]
AAGYVDGEGCICVSRNGGENRTYSLKFSVSSTVLASLLRLQHLFGGRVKGPYTRRGERPLWYWTLCGREAQAALMKLLPYLTVKAPEAELAIQFPWGQAPGVRLEQIILTQRQEIAERLRNLKHECL